MTPNEVAAANCSTIFAIVTAFAAKPKTAEEFLERIANELQATAEKLHGPAQEAVAGTCALLMATE